MPSRARWGRFFASVILVAAGLSLASVRPASAESVYPLGFGVTTIDSGQGKFNLTDFVFLPAGGILTSGKDGRVVHISPDLATQKTIAQINVATDGDLGLVGIDLAPDYAETRRIYAVYSYADNGWRARLVEWTVDNAATPRSIALERVIVDDMVVDNPTHAVGKVLADADGTIWLGMGDGADPFKTDPLALRAQSLDGPHGKILRVNLDGTGVASNPFFDPSSPSSWKSRTWAYGLRNPFRFTMHPDKTLYIGDVGQTLREEMDLGVKGANYGWPCWEGNVKNSFQAMPECRSIYAADTTVKPLFDYGRIAKGGSITGGEFAIGGVYPEPYNGSMIFADFAEMKVWTFETNSFHQLTRAPEGGIGDQRTPDAFGTEARGPVSFRRGPTGEIHWAEIYRGEIFKLTYSHGNRPPVAQAGSEQTYGNPTVKFFGSASSDPDGDALSYEWDFGDGAMSTAADPVHTYPAASRYTATLTVHDGKGLSSTAQVKVVLDDHAPTFSVTGPPPDKQFYVDELITATAAAGDVEDAGLGPEDVHWRADIVHCADEGCHTHPGRVSTGAVFSMPFPDHGVDVTVRVTAWVQDSAGHEATQAFDATPRLQTLTLSSSMSPVAFRVNNEPAPPSNQLTLVAGSLNTVHALDGHNMVFDAWAGTDSSTASTQNPRTLRMPPAGDVELHARYRAVGFELSFAPAADGSSMHANVKLTGRSGDAWSMPTGSGCSLLPPVAGDDGDGLVEVGETWEMPCMLGPTVFPPDHLVTVSSPTPNGGSLNGLGVVPVGVGYRMVASDGGIFSFGAGEFYGSMGGAQLNQDIVAMAATPSGKGYWMIASDGGMFSFGDAQFFGSMGGQPLPAPIVAMATTPTGRGYWMVAADGTVYHFGDAAFFGTLHGVPLNSPIVAMAATRSGQGYWLVAADGGMFSFGDAQFFGSMGGQRLNLPIVGMAPTPTGKGYWQVALDGGVFSFGDARFFGSMGGKPLNQPIVGMTVSPSGNGYWQVATDGGMFSFGDAQFFGSMGGTKLNEPVVGMTTTVIARL